LINEYIPHGNVRLIDENGENVGIVSRDVALQRAVKANLDLVCVAPEAKPIVVKILDYSRYRYEQQKRLKEIKKNQKIVQLKEVQLSPTIGIHDFNTKLKNAKRFIADGNKVKVTMRLYGRMMSRQELGLEVINNFILEMEEIATLESSAKMEGRTLIAILNPKKE